MAPSAQLRKDLGPRPEPGGELQQGGRWWKVKVFTTQGGEPAQRGDRGVGFAVEFSQGRLTTAASFEVVGNGLQVVLGGVGQS